ncbi:MAG: hypothetical protein EBZ59_10750 [Planctomycetia bacterium]|nr:hypothetical protein [Planctomycetia bacterium]
MRPLRTVMLGLAGLALLACLSGLPAAASEAAPAADPSGDAPADRHGCTAAEPCGACVPACSSSWEEKKVKKPKYSMKCDYACDRAYECWCTGPTECRCSPPCGKVFVRKKLFKEETEKVERVPKYEVKMVPAAPCDCSECRRCHHGHQLCWWDPLGLLSCLRGW